MHDPEWFSFALLSLCSVPKAAGCPVPAGGKSCREPGTPTLHPKSWKTARTGAGKGCQCLLADCGQGQTPGTDLPADRALSPTPAAIPEPWNVAPGDMESPDSRSARAAWARIRTQSVLEQTIPVGINRCHSDSGNPGMLWVGSDFRDAIPAFLCLGEALKHLSCCGELISELHLCVQAGTGVAVLLTSLSCRAIASLCPIKHSWVTQLFSHHPSPRSPSGLDTQI